MRQRASLFAGLLVVAGIAAGASAGVVGYVSSSATEGVRGILGTMPPSDLSLGLAMALAADPAEQDRTARTTFAGTLRDGGRGIPIDVHTSIESVIPVETPRSRAGAEPPRVDVASATGLDAGADLVAGRWGAGVGEATMQADAAAALDVTPGDELSIGGVDVVIVGTWRVADPQAARWMGDERWTTGIAGASYGPLIVDAALWNEIDATPWMHWVVVPDIERLQASDLAAISAAWAGVSDAMSAAGLEPGSRSGRFIASAAEVAPRLAALRTALPLSLVVVVVIGALALWEIAGFAARARSAESALLWSRGATTAALAARAAVESAVVAAIGGLIGIAAATALIRSLRGGEAATAVASAGPWAGAAAVTVAGIAFAVRTAATRMSAHASGGVERGRRYTAIGALVVLAVAAVLSTWQLLTYGPVSTTALGDAAVDPVTIVAPALILASIVLLALCGFPLLATVAERRAARASGPAVAMRSVFRRASAASAAIVMVGLAVGQVVLAAGYGATWTHAFTQASSLQAGAALRLVAAPPGIDTVDLDRAKTASGVSGLAPVRTASVGAGGEQADLVAVAPRAIAALGSDGESLLDPDALAAAITPVGAQPLLPEGATRITVDVGASRASVHAVWLSDAWGRLHEVAMSEVGGVTTEATAQLPAGTAPWRLAGVDLTPASADPEASVSIVSVSTDAGSVTTPTVPLVLRPDVAAAAGGARPVIRILPAAGATVGAVSDWLARRIGAHVGDLIAVTVTQSAPQLTVVVSAVVPAIPGSASASGILVGAAAMDALALRTEASPDEPASVWVGSLTPDETAASLRGVLPARISVRDVASEPDRAMLAAGATALWIAAGGGCALAIAGLIAVCASLQRERRGEAGIMGALGFTSRQQGRMRRNELETMTAWGFGAGLAGGAVVIGVAVAALARAAVPGAYESIPTAPRFDILAGGASLVVMALAIAIVIVAAGAAAGARSRSAGPVEGDS